MNTILRTLLQHNFIYLLSVYLIFFLFLLSHVLLLLRICQGHSICLWQKNEKNRIANEDAVKDVWQKIIDLRVDVVDLLFYNSKKNLLKMKFS